MNFQKSNWNWQLSQLKQRIEEWFEYEFSHVQQHLPQWSISPVFIRLIKFLFLLLVGLFLAWICWQLWQNFGLYIRSRIAKTFNAKDVGIKNSETELSVAQLYGRSQEFYHEANYRQACKYIYLALLQYLHEKAVLPQKPSRTDGEYLQLLQLSVSPMQPYETLITTHEQLCFDNLEVDSDNYQQCKQAYEQIAQTGDWGIGSGE